MSIWYGLAYFGEIFCLLTAYLLIFILQWNWSTAFLLYNGLYFLSSVALLVNMNELENESEGKTIREISQEIRQHYSRQTSNKLYTPDYLFLANLILVIGFWLPYYLSRIGL